MHDIDRYELERICGGDPLDEATLALYLEFQVAHHRAGSGPMDTNLLKVIGVLAGKCKPRPLPPHPFDNVQQGAYVMVRNAFSPRIEYEGTYLGICRGGIHDGMVEIAGYGELSRRSFEMPDRVQELGRVPEWADKVRPNEPVYEPEPEPLVEIDPELAAEEDTLTEEQINEALAKHPAAKWEPGLQLTVAEDGQPLLDGNYLSIDRDTGYINVRFVGKGKNAPVIDKLVSPEDVRVYHDSKGDRAINKAINKEFAPKAEPAKELEPVA